MVTPIIAMPRQMPSMSVARWRSWAYWFEEPVAPEDLDGYRELRAGLRVNISGGEAEFNRWGWRQILKIVNLISPSLSVCDW